MSALVRIFRGNAWILKITVLSIILGMLLAASLKTQMHWRKENDISTTRFPELAANYRVAKQENANLRQRIQDQEKQIARYEEIISKGNTAAGTLDRELQEAKFLAGLTAAEGPGVIVTLRDGKMPPRDPNPFLWIIHDTDIERVVNELRASGAEAISVNDQRLIVTSAIRCVGPVTQVNGVALGSPYEIKAIGKPETLESGLRTPGGVADNFPDDSMIQIKQEQNITIRPFDGSLRFKWARKPKS